MTRKLLLFWFCLILQFPFSGMAATFNVNSTTDAVDANPGNGICATTSGSCTLRAATMETRALAGEDEINIPAGIYVLTIAGAGEDSGATGDLDLSNVRINGFGTVIIDGGGIDRVLDISNSTLIGIIIQNGSTFEHGGGVRCNAGTACFLYKVTVRANSSNAWGGGIRNQGILTIFDSTIHNNSCTTHGGGISNLGGNLIIRNTTISGNRADFDSGGIDIDGMAHATLLNTTITNNTTDDDDNGTGNGGGISIFSGTANLLNTIVANNNDSGGETPDCNSTINSQGYNLIRNLNGCTITGDETGNIYALNPMLSPLGGHGGPTLTHALQLGSPAIDTGSSEDCPVQDQRGVPRPEGAGCDIGSFEYDFSFLYTDNFEDGDASDWIPLKGSWSVVAGELSGTHDRNGTILSPFVGCSTDCSVSALMKVQTPGGRASLIAFYENKRNLVEVILMEDKNRVVLKQRKDGQVVAKGKFLMPVDVGVDYPISVIHTPGSLVVEIDGSTVIDLSTAFSSEGGVGFKVKSTTGTPNTARFEEIFVY